MTTSGSVRETSRQPIRLPARFFSGIVFGLLLTVLVPVSHAQQHAPSGEELYVDNFGCWNCHGKTGDGGVGPPIAKTVLPLRRFIGQIRLPSKVMPPFVPILASDAELTIVYNWLAGVDPVKIPPAITINLKSSSGAGADSAAKAGFEVEVTALVADPANKSAVPAPGSLRYRVALITNWKTPVNNLTLEYQLAGRKDWSKVTTDEVGEALLDPKAGFVVTDSQGESKPSGRLRFALPSDKFAVTVEALDYTAPDKPVVVGIGSIVLVKLD